MRIKIRKKLNTDIFRRVNSLLIGLVLVFSIPVNQAVFALRAEPHTEGNAETSPRVAEVSSENTNPMGDFTHYNGMIFDYFEAAQADVEGALAVGGESWFGTSGQFDVGVAIGNNGSSTILIGQYQNPNGYPSLLLNSLPKIGNETKNDIQVYGGSIVMSEKIEEKYWALNNRFIGQETFANDVTVDNTFADFKKDAVNTTQVLNKAQQRTEGNILLNELIGWGASAAIQAYENFVPDNLDISDTDIDSVAVLNIIDDGHVTINSPQITNDYEQYNLIIFNFPNASSIEMTGGSVHIDGNQINTSAPGGIWPEQSALLKKYAEKIIWNFPQASAVNIYAHGVVGSIMAFEALVSTNGGSINGMLVADSFVQTNGHELHAFSMNRAALSFKNMDDSKTPDDSEPTESPDDPESTESPDDPEPTETPDDPEPTEMPDDPEPTESPDGPEPTETPNDPKPTETPDVPESTESPDGPEPTESPDDSEPTESPDDPESTESPDAPEPSETPDAPEPTETPDAPEPTEIPDDSKPTETPDDPEPTESPDDPEPTKSPDDPEPTETPDDPESSKSPDDPEPSESPNDSDNSELSDNPDLPQRNLSTRVPETGDGINIIFFFSLIFISFGSLVFLIKKKGIKTK